MMLDLVSTGHASLPKNINGFRTTHTCELCGFEPKTKNKYREKQDHLVMKHFKERIDKIFPHCRPYSCPSGDCSFTGKDKQALLRHYTGKHGILERYLREALAEKGISYVPGDHGGKRKSHSNSTDSNKSKQLRMTPPTLMDPKEICLPNTPVPLEQPQQPQIRPNTEELRKEVEAMMASFQPQPVETQQQHVVLNLPTVPIEQQQQQQQQQGTVVSDAGGSAVKTTVLSLQQNPVVTRVQLPTQPVVTSINSMQPQQQPPSSVVSLVRRAASEKITLPSLIVQQHNNSQNSVPIEVITTVAATTVAANNGNNGVETRVVVENEEVMWGAGTNSGPAVVVEAADTVPVTYIEAVDAAANCCYATSAAGSLDNIDYEYLYPSNNTNETSVRERQLDFCML